MNQNSQNSEAILLRQKNKKLVSQNKKKKKDKLQDQKNYFI